LPDGSNFDAVLNIFFHKTIEFLGAIFSGAQDFIEF
jgi:hypothetical protein